MGLQAAVHLGHMPWALTKEEEVQNDTHRFCVQSHRDLDLYSS
jgi:hypothetical protein